MNPSSVGSIGMKLGFVKISVFDLNDAPTSQSRG
jgi:hypothetical protein